MKWCGVQSGEVVCTPGHFICKPPHHFILSFEPSGRGEVVMHSRSSTPLHSYHFITSKIVHCRCKCITPFHSLNQPFFSSSPSYPHRHTTLYVSLLQRCTTTFHYPSPLCGNLTASPLHTVALLLRTEERLI